MTGNDLRAAGSGHVFVAAAWKAFDSSATIRVLAFAGVHSRLLLPEACPGRVPAPKADSAFKGRRHTKMLGFTVLELIIVLSIIGILICLLFPTIAAMRARAQTVGCAANLSQIGRLAYVYANENHGWILRKGHWPNDAWQSLHRPWVIMIDKDIGQLSLPGMALRCAKIPILKCPAHPQQSTPTNYVVNAFALPRPRNGNELAGPTLLEKVRFPSKVIFLTELKDNYLPWSDASPPASDYYLAGWISTVEVAYSQDLPSYVGGQPRVAKDRHGNNTVNALFFDGSVRLVKSMDLTPDDFDDGIRNHKDRMILGPGPGWPPPPR